jgi:hypothetical protein
VSFAALFGIKPWEIGRLTHAQFERFRNAVDERERRST